MAQGGRPYGLQGHFLEVVNAAIVVIVFFLRVQVGQIDPTPACVLILRGLGAARMDLMPGVVVKAQISGPVASANVGHAVPKEVEPLLADVLVLAERVTEALIPDTLHLTAATTYRCHVLVLSVKRIVVRLGRDDLGLESVYVVHFMAVVPSFG